MDDIEDSVFQDSFGNGGETASLDTVGENEFCGQGDGLSRGYGDLDSSFTGRGSHACEYTSCIGSGTGLADGGGRDLEDGHG